VKSLRLLVVCDVAGCNRERTERGVSKGAIIGELVGLGWRFGATRDVCPSCRDKGHRP
jgi:hypothetical protein